MYVVQVSDAALCTLAHQVSLYELNLEDCSKLTDQGLACLQGKMPVLFPSFRHGPSCYHLPAHVATVL